MITASTINNETPDVSSAWPSRSLESWSIEVDGNDVRDICWQRGWQIFLGLGWTIFIILQHSHQNKRAHVCLWISFSIIHTRISVDRIVYTNILCIIYDPDKILIILRIGCHFCPQIKCMLQGYPFQPLSCTGTSLCTVVVCFQRTSCEYSLACTHSQIMEILLLLPLVR